jgi:hypothetical protein
MVRKSKKLIIKKEIPFDKEEMIEVMTEVIWQNSSGKGLTRKERGEIMVTVVPKEIARLLIEGITSAMNNPTKDERKEKK